jgi:hypothetical protein
MMTKEDAKAIVDVVSTDPEAVKRIDSNIDAIVPASWGIAGGIRNAGYVALNVVTFGAYADPTEEEFANRVCTGIANATSDAINRAVRAKDARLRRVAAASVVNRTYRGTDHTATSVAMIDGQIHVIDWHATLDQENPMLYRNVHEWSTSSGGIPFKDFSGWD